MYMLDKVTLSGVVFRLKRHFANKQVLTLKAKSSEKLLVTPTGAARNKRKVGDIFLL